MVSPNPMQMSGCCRTGSSARWDCLIALAQILLRAPSAGHLDNQSGFGVEALLIADPSVRPEGGRVACSRVLNCHEERRSGGRCQGPGGHRQ